MPEIALAATDLDLISLLRVIPDPRMQRGERSGVSTEIAEALLRRNP
ncbi:MAG: hypothetical protein WAM11_06765 [Cyanobium sp.]